VASEQRGLRLTPTERKRLQQVLRHEVRGAVAMRVAVVLWSAQGRSTARIARAPGVAPRTVHRCRERWRQHGMEGLAGRAPSRPASSRHRGVPPVACRTLTRGHTVPGVSSSDSFHFSHSAEACASPATTRAAAPNFSIRCQKSTRRTTWLFAGA